MLINYSTIKEAFLNDQLNNWSYIVSSQLTSMEHGSIANVIAHIYCVFTTHINGTWQHS